VRVLIVNTSEKTGGAAVAAHRLMEALNNHGVKAKMLVRDKQSDHLSVVGLPKSLLLRWHFLWERLVIFLANGLSRKNLFKVSIANAGSDITKLPEFKEADIVHLHWVNQGMLSLKDIEKILRSGKPVVWTMHDMWPLTAICHHAYGCRRFQTACGECPFLRFPSAHDLSNRVFRKKQNLYNKTQVTFVAVSNWLANCAKQSALLKASSISVVPNALSVSQFSMTDRSDARSVLQLNTPYLVVFGAARIDDDIKGLPYLLQALSLLVSRGDFCREDIQLLIFGGVKDRQIFSKIPVDYTYYGYVDDIHQVSLLYSASNVVVSSSLYETFGQTIIEAQACGCTPVAFGGSGQEDIISHKVNGYLAERLSVEDLAEGIRWALTANLQQSALRNHVLKHYSESPVALKYTEVYNQALAMKHYKL